METPTEEKQQLPDLLTISDLISRSLPFTATSSLNLNLSISKHHSHSPPYSSATSNPNPKILTPLTRPSVLVGTLTLPDETLPCLNHNCLQFSDASSSSSVCCDVLDFDIQLIAKKNMIRVLSWNFIPMKCRGGGRGGFLEIVKWRFQDPLDWCLGLDSIPLSLNSLFPLSVCNVDKSKACHCVHGPIESISPVSVVPCLVGSNELQSLRGFVVRVLVCECRFCSAQDCLVNNLVQGGGGDGHSFTKESFVYFCGSSWCWHPVMVKLVGSMVGLSGLKKKLVFIEKEESQLMFVTTNVSVLHFPWPHKRWFPSLKMPIKGRGECGVYSGVVKGVYLKGMVVELDKEVWLLLTDQQLAVPHSLRVGASVSESEVYLLFEQTSKGFHSTKLDQTEISVRNVHFVNTKFSWMKVLVLGACFRTNVVVESFSPLEMGCFTVSSSQSQLEKFVNSLPFSPRLWALLVISCFQKKFTGIFPEKEILGSKHKEGLAQKFIKSHLVPRAPRSRHGLLREFCKHDCCGCGEKPGCHNLKLVLPLYTFLCHCEAIWLKMLHQSEKGCQTLGNNSNVPYKQRVHDHPLRMIIPSHDLGVAILGRLEISPSSERLQLVDATGSIDVMIPDLPSSWMANIIYVVSDYKLIVEGEPKYGNHLVFCDHETLSCNHLFDFSAWARILGLTFSVYFYLNNAICENVPFHPYVKEDIRELHSGRFHLIRISHIYPMLHKFQESPVTVNRSTVFVDTILLPWDLYLSGKDGTATLVNLETNLSNECLDHLPSKKQRIYQTLLPAPTSGLTDGSYDGSKSSSCSYPCRKHAGSIFENLSHEINCLVTIRISNGQDIISSGKLCCTKCKIKRIAECESSIDKVLLEFDPESIFKCQVGTYYIIKHHPEESFCCFKERDNVKVCITSKVHFWSLSFLSNVAVRNNQSSNDTSEDDFSLSSREFSFRDQVEFSCRSPQWCSDVYLDLSANVIDPDKVKRDAMKAGFPIKPLIINDNPNVLSTTSGSLGASCVFPEGDLISVVGDVVAIYGSDQTSTAIDLGVKTLGDELNIRHCHGVTNALDIHVLVDRQMVIISGSLTKNAYPVGFGTGVTATFHRVLNSSNSGGKTRLMLIPVTFIEVHTIRVAYEPHLDSFPSFQSALHVPTPASFDDICGLISQSKEGKKSQGGGVQWQGYVNIGKRANFSATAVALHVLVLEKNKIYNGLHLQVHSRHSVHVTLAGFMLDDGSSTCSCWANDERAASLLRLQEELPLHAFVSSGCTKKFLGLSKTSWKNKMFHLERILKKHGKITVRNCGSMVDSNQQDFLISAGSENPLSSTDEKLLKFIAFNACFGTTLNVVATVMDADAVEQMENEHLIEEMSMRHMLNVWAVGVCYPNALSKARKMIQELQTN